MAKQLYIVEYKDSNGSKDWVTVVWKSNTWQDARLLEFARQRIVEDHCEDEPEDLRAYPVAIADGEAGTYNIGVMEQ